MRAVKRRSTIVLTGEVIRAIVWTMCNRGSCGVHGDRAGVQVKAGVRGRFRPLRASDEPVLLECSEGAGVNGG